MQFLVYLSKLQPDCSLRLTDNLCLSLRTVQAHLGHIFNKMQVSSRTEAVVRALKEGLVTLNDIP